MDKKSDCKVQSDLEENFNAKDFAVGIAKSFVSDFINAAAATPKQMLSLVTAGPATVWGDMKNRTEDASEEMCGSGLSRTCQAPVRAKKTPDKGKDASSRDKSHPVSTHS